MEISSAWLGIVPYMATMIPLVSQDISLIQWIFFFMKEPVSESCVVYRSLSQKRGQDKDYVPKLGRPISLVNGVKDPTLNSDRNLWVLTWLRKVWTPANVDKDPVGGQYYGAINVIRLPDIYKEMCNAWKDEHLRQKYAIPSLTLFRTLFQFWMKDSNIRMRMKKNVGAKCKGNDSLLFE
jgi:hypothetical protein